MNYLEKFRHIHTFIFDVDGVMTNNDLIVMENGRLLRTMNTRDGYALKTAVQAGYRVAVITGGKSSGVAVRLEALGITDIYKGVEDKLDAFEEYIETYNIDTAGVLYMGDDIPDYLPMRRVGLPACPADATVEIVSISQYISPLNGGAGCVRDVIEKVLKLQGKWMIDPDQKEANSLSDQSNS
ncbi:MAG: 3-deoxy-D-manno-octulosonate 8-phosphate phosphatase (KDO 8-P phosphatase) [Saprospiraceae bacterium]|jgi:3-deoxy-D-manno-octulosonate 8-phosphate phosphatase (KDO 8-P phosphatase)